MEKVPRLSQSPGTHIVALHTTTSNDRWAHLAIWISRSDRLR